MKKLILLILLIPSLLFAGPLQQAHKKVIAGQTVAGGGWAGFSDDFNDADGALGASWSVTSGGISIESNRAQYTLKSASNRATAVMATNPNLSSGTVQADVNEEGSEYRQPCVVFWYTDENNYWYATVHCDGTDDLELWQVVSGTPALIDEGGGNLSSGTAYEVKVVFAADGVDVYLDTVLTIEDTTVRSNSGNVGIGFVGSSELGWVDDFIATE